MDVPPCHQVVPRSVETVARSDVARGNLTQFGVDERRLYFLEHDVVLRASPSMTSENKGETINYPGDKFRLTVIIALARKHWFDHTKIPVTKILKHVLLVHSKTICRLKDITSEHTWARDHYIQDEDGHTVHRQRGQKTNRLLAA